jgi:hypothetical protein
MRQLAVVVGLALTLVAGSVRAAEDFTGKWTGTFVGTAPDGRQQDDTVFLDLTQKGNVLTGTGGPTAEKQFPLLNGTVKGNDLAFDVQADGVLIKFTLTYASGHLKGDAAAEMGGQKMAARIDAQRKTGF